MLRQFGLRPGSVVEQYGVQRKDRDHRRHLYTQTNRLCLARKSVDCTQVYCFDTDSSKDIQADDKLVCTAKHALLSLQLVQLMTQMPLQPLLSRCDAGGSKRACLLGG